MSENRNGKNENLKYLGRLFTLSTANDTDGDGEDQKASFFADWIFQKVGFEVYTEFGIDDFMSNPLENPFHTAIYTFGLKQNIPMKSEKLRSEIILEINNFEMSQDFQLEWCYGGYYTHGKILSGYTNNGQILGAGSGSLGNSQILSYILYHPKGNINFFIHRYCPNNNYIFNKAVYDTAKVYPLGEGYWSDYETYLIFGLQSDNFIKSNLDISCGIDLILQRYNMYIWYNNNIQFSFNLGAKYIF